MTRATIAFIGIILLAFVVFWVNYLLTPTTPANTYTIGSVTTVNLDTIVSLTNSEDVISANNYDSLHTPRGTNYQVPADTTLYLTLIAGVPDSAPNSFVQLSIGYGDDAVSDSATPPTNPIILGIVSFDTATAAIDISRPLPALSVPAGKYPFILATTEYNILVSGVEIAAN